MTRPNSTIVGLLACQADSYLQNLKTKVVSTKQGKNGYEVLFEDTVFFPEGGGQPNDVGFIKLVGDDSEQIGVKDVQRDGLNAVHYIDKDLKPGAEVEMKIDWRRRWDLMQQHTGQHLLSAILDKRNLNTISWSMGAKFNYIEIPRKMTPEEITEVQQEVTDAISESIGIQVELPEDFKDHHVPEDYDLSKGVIRVIKIGALDCNPCCGTHLSNTSHIGALSLLHQQNIRGTNSRLFFMAGDRVSRYASEANEIIKKVNASLSCQTEDIESKLSKLNLQLKDAAAREKKLTEQLAKVESDSVKTQLEKYGFSLLYKPTGDANYLKILEKELGKNFNGTLVYYTGESKKPGSIVILGGDVESYVAKIKELVPEVKGGGKGKWQGKVVSWDKAALEAMAELNK